MDQIIKDSSHRTTKKMPFPKDESYPWLKEIISYFFNLSKIRGGGKAHYCTPFVNLVTFNSI